MPFRPRNPYYLRVSERTVLPLYLYLDDRHLEWMSDKVLQFVLQDIRPHILPKLNTALADEQSNNEKKSSVETHRGECYQFCYFLRKVQPHTVLAKSRTFTAQPVLPSSHKRKTNDRSVQPRKRPKNKGKGKAVEEASNDEDEDVTSSSIQRRSSRRAHRTAADTDKDAYTPEDNDWQMDSPDLDVDEKPKPILHIKYRGFDIMGHCLCIVVEPWPHLRAPSVLPSAPSRSRSRTPATNAAAMLAPPVPEANALRRERTPLFLPDNEDRERSQTPFPSASTNDRLSSLPPVPLFNEAEAHEEEDGWGMMEFSQVIHSSGDQRAGPLDEDDDMEGAVFFGDADEVKEL